jgi:hypothetical protein
MSSDDLHTKIKVGIGIGGPMKDGIGTSRIDQN